METLFPTRGAHTTTRSLVATTLLAARHSMPVITRTSQLADIPSGSLAIVDIDMVTPETLIDLGERFRMLGIGLIVAHRPGQELPYEVRRNLETAIEL